TRALSRRRGSENPHLFPSLQRASALKLGKDDALQFDDLFDLLGQGQLATASAKGLFRRAKVVMDSRLTHVSASSAYSAAAAFPATLSPCISNRPPGLVGGWNGSRLCWRKASWIRGAAGSSDPSGVPQGHFGDEDVL